MQIEGMRINANCAVGVDDFLFLLFSQWQFTEMSEYELG